MLKHKDEANQFAAVETYPNGTLHYAVGHNCGSDEMPRLLGIINGFFLMFVAYIIPLIIIIVNYTRLIAFILKESKSQIEAARTSQVRR